MASEKSEGYLRPMVFVELPKDASIVEFETSEGIFDLTRFEDGDIQIKPSTDRNGDVPAGVENQILNWLSEQIS